MKNISVISLSISIAIILALGISSCVTSNFESEKTGVQLWGENCNGYHNTPLPVDFHDVIRTHMKVRVNLADEEIKKNYSVPEISKLIEEQKNI